MQILKSENDFYTSVTKALDEIDPKWETYSGLMIVGSHTPKEIERKIQLIKQAREKNIPFLGICLGMQLMVIEYARHELGYLDATSEELEHHPSHMVITKLLNLRVGIRKVAWADGDTYESHWHNFAFNNEFKKEYSDNFDIVYSEGIAEVMRLRTHPFFMGVQFHPEYQSSKENPHPLLVNFLEACKQYQHIVDGQKASVS